MNEHSKSKAYYRKNKGKKKKKGRDWSNTNKCWDAHIRMRKDT